MRFADYCYLVETGHIGGQGTPAEVQAGELIQRIYLGGQATPSSHPAGDAS